MLHKLNKANRGTMIIPDEALAHKVDLPAANIKGN